jgi:hypothetical protein
MSGHIDDRSSHLIGVCVGRTIQLYRAPELIACGSIASLNTVGSPAAAVIGWADRSSRGGGLLVFYPGLAECYPDANAEGFLACLMAWTPACSEDDDLAHPLVHVALNGGDSPMEVLGLDAHGGIRLCRLRLASAAAPEMVSWPAPNEPFLACARIDGNRVAGVTRTGIHWLHRSAPHAVSVTPLRLSRPVAAFVLPVAGDLLIVDADCSLTRVPIRE